MSRWMRTAILLLLIGATKAHHIKVIVLALLGLAGLFLMQNYTQASRPPPKLFENFSVGGLATRLIQKRATDIAESQKEERQINWELIISNDPASCARSFVCQLAAAQPKKLSANEKSILDYIRKSNDKPTWAAKQILLAVANGEKAKHGSQCLKIYSKCPYSRSTMLMLITLFRDGL